MYFLDTVKISSSFPFKRAKNTFLAIHILGCAFLSTDANASETPLPIDKAAKELGVIAKPPIQYVVDKFDQHDVVFLGESHYVKENLEFLQELIPALYEAGVHALVWEFANDHQQDKLDRLTTSDKFDAELADQLMADWYGFGYREYRDVYETVWRLNKDLAPDRPKFRIIAVNIMEPYTKRDPALKGYDQRAKAFGGSVYNVINYHWSRIIDREVIQKDKKALIYAGFGHTSTRFFQFRGRPAGNGLSAGNFIYEYIQDRTVSILMHGAAGNERLLSTVDGAFKRSPQSGRSGGFDLAGTTIGQQPITAFGVRLDTGKASDFMAEDLADGYVYLGKPACAYSPVALIEGFVDDSTLGILHKTVAPELSSDSTPTPKDYEDFIRSRSETYWIKQRKSRFHCDD